MELKSINMIGNWNVVGMTLCISTPDRIECTIRDLKINLLLLSLLETLYVLRQVSHECFFEVFIMVVIRENCWEMAVFVESYCEWQSRVNKKDATHSGMITKFWRSGVRLQTLWDADVAMTLALGSAPTKNIFSWFIQDKFALISFRLTFMRH